MLRLALVENLTTQQAALKYIGERLRVRAELPEWTSDIDVARYLLKYVTAYLFTEVVLPNSVSGAHQLVKEHSTGAIQIQISYIDRSFKFLVKS